jgi:hypothetical protein
MRRSLERAWADWTGPKLDRRRVGLSLLAFLLASAYQRYADPNWKIVGSLPAFLAGFAAILVFWIGGFLWDWAAAPSRISRDEASGLRVANADLKQRIEALTNKPKLEVRFLSIAPYIYLDGQYTHYRIGVYNPGPAKIEHVKMELLSITPLPTAGTFSANFPYPVRRENDPEPKHNERINADGKTLNPDDEERFEPLWFWLSSDNRVMVDGLDTKPIQWDGKFEMQEEESWCLRYRVSSAQTRSQITSFLVRREGTRVVMEENPC